MKVGSIFENRDNDNDFSAAECILKALNLCLKCINSVFNERFYFQEDGTAMGPHMFRSYTLLCMIARDCNPTLAKKNSFILLEI